MQIPAHILQTKPKAIPNKLSLIPCIILCLVMSICVKNHDVWASSSEYSITTSNVTLDGTNNGSVTIALRTSVARSYTAIQGTWSNKETAQTSYLSLSKMKRGGSAAIAYGANGTGAWTPEDGTGMLVVAGGEVLSATYTIDKDTPAGTYEVSFSNGLFTYDINGSDVDETDIIALVSTITVTRSNPSSTDSEAPAEQNTPAKADSQSDSDKSTEHKPSENHDDSTKTDDAANHADSAEHDSSTENTNSSASEKHLSTDVIPSSETSDNTSTGNSTILIVVISLVVVVALALAAFIFYRKKIAKKS